MAEIAVQFVIQRLNDFLTQEAELLLGVDGRIRSLRDKLEWMHALLKDLHGNRRENDRVKVWVAQIREAAYDAEDIIDSYIFNIEKQRRETSAGFKKSIRNFACCIKDIPTIHNLGKKISDIERRLNEISSNRSDYGIGNIPALQEASSSSNQNQIWRQKRAPIVEEADVVGVEDETKTLVGQLIEGDARRVVVSITGMGGIGKTTLAKKVYNNIHVKKSFDFHAWVYVSQEYHVRELLVSIINYFTSLSRDEMDTTSEEVLGRKLFEYLEGKRYLVVIDDIWTRDAWDGLVAAFPDKAKGSRVLLTTRNEEIAKYADARSTPHKIRFLDESESWVLFCKKALPGNLAPSCPLNLEELGRKIIAKCGGLPLAIAVLGGVLSRKEKSVNEWDKVLKRVEWWLHESKEDGILGILALSYHDMPYYLKPCFLYFGAFPEDFEIPVAKLIKMWIAEGFVQRIGEEEVEDVAEDYLNELVGRSLIQVAERKSNGTAKTCCIHDLLHDLSIAKAKEEIFLEVYRNIASTSRTKARRLAITSGDISKSISLNRSVPHLRSLLHFSRDREMHFSRDREMLEKPQLKILVGAFKFLRVMHLQIHGISDHPDEIGYLIHLRYLCLKVRWLKSLPSTITRLSNLQTLDLRHTSVNKLPDDVWKLKQLRHLRLSKTLEKCKISESMQLHRLRNLQTLEVVEAGSWIEEGLERMTNLRELGIMGDFNITLSHSLCKLNHLRSLWLEVSWGCNSILPLASFSNHQHLYNMSLSGTLEKLPSLHEFPPNLTQLNLERSRLERDPMGVLEKLPYLRMLTLCNVGCYKEMVCSVGGFRQLEHLWILNLDELEEWRVEEGAMPNLRFLEILKCRRLKMVPDGLGHVTTLRELVIKKMPEEFKERVREEGVDWFKIRRIPSLIIKGH